jgi:hypothetical protein
MERAEIDGVPVLWRDQPGPFGGMLVFGVGSLDEGLDEQGFGYVIQEAATAGLPAPAATSDLTGPDTTSFSVIGSPDEVGAYLTALCRALSGPLDVTSVDLADRLTDYLIDPPHRDPWASLVARRLRAYDRWPSVPEPPPVEVTRFRDTWFTAGNAVLILTGPPPAGLRLPLTPGPRPTHPVRVAAGMPLSWYADSVAAPGLSFVAADRATAYPVTRALMRRIDGALQQAREPVQCFPDAIGFAPDGYLFGLTLGSLRESTQGDAARQAEILWTEVRRFADEGPSTTDLEAAASTASPKLPESVARWRALFELSGDADRELLGYSVEEESAADPSAEALAGLLPSAVMVVPAGARPALPGLSEFSCADATYLPPGDEVRPPLLKRRSTRLRLIISTDSVSTVDEAGVVHTIPRDDLLVIGGDGLWLGHAGHGCSTDVSAYAGFEERLAALVPPQRHRVTE